MKKSFFILLLSILFYPFLTRAQTPQLEILIDANQCDSINNFSAATGCDYWVSNSSGDTVFQDVVPSFNSNWPVTLPYDSIEAPYFVNFDMTCLNSNGVNIDDYSIQVENIHPVNNDYWADSVYVCSNTTSVDYSVMMLTPDCSNSPRPSNSLAEGCDYWVEDVNGTIVYQDQIENTNSNFYLGGFSFPYNSGIPPYELHFDQTCLNDNGIGFDNYTFSLVESATDSTIFDNVPICTYTDTTLVADTCNDLYSNVGPYIGYYQNYTNYLNFEVGNNSNTTQSVTVEITMPPGVTPISSSFDFPYTVSGSVLTVSASLPPFAHLSDIIKFNVPGGLNDGTIHVYGIDIFNNDNSAVDCEQWNNQDTIHQIVGNSYDPNAKTVGLPKDINADTQEEFLYTIYFQNTGTAPAQDIYLLDTLSDNLDWSTFEFVRSSHVVGISDLGNGVKKFYFDDIWLPDTTMSIPESNGFVTFKIKEKPNNSAGTEIMNTAYIYFDHNPAIVTNTTYNINVDNLGLESFAKKLNIRLHPNPANESIQIEGSHKIDKVEVYSVDGKVCWTSEPFQSEVNLDISEFNSGLYLVKVQSSERTKTLRFIKK